MLVEIDYNESSLSAPGGVAEYCATRLWHIDAQISHVFSEKHVMTYMANLKAFCLPRNII